MTRYKSLLAALLFPSLSFATVKFNCYSLFNAPVQAYVAGSLNCDPEAEPEKVVKKNGRTVVMCFYQAMCEPLAPGEHADQLTPKEVLEMQKDPNTEKLTTFKPSGISCMGHGILKQGILKSISCPEPNECTKDVVFTAAMKENFYPGQNAVIIKPKMEKEKKGAE